MSNYTSDEQRLRALATHLAGIRQSQANLLAAMEKLSESGNHHAEGWACGIRGALAELTVLDPALDGVAPYTYGA
jgi:hypothetical protein